MGGDLAQDAEGAHLALVVVSLKKVGKDLKECEYIVSETTHRVSMKKLKFGD